MCWFKTRNYIDKTKLVNRPAAKVSISSYTQGAGFIIYSTWPNTHKLTTSDEYISILADSPRSGGFKILEIPDEYTFKVKDNGTEITASLATWKVQKAQARWLEISETDRNPTSEEQEMLELFLGISSD